MRKIRYFVRYRQRFQSCLVIWICATKMNGSIFSSLSKKRFSRLRPLLIFMIVTEGLEKGEPYGSGGETKWAGGTMGRLA